MLGENIMIFYIADVHFGHYNIIRFCHRPFTSVEEMDAALIKNWNAKVGSNDTVYIIGDLFTRFCKDPATILNQLKGKKRLILGNHEPDWINKVDLNKYFVSVERMSVFGNGSCKVTACHYPMLSFEGDYLIYGHIHNHTDERITDKPMWDYIMTRDNMLNAGVEINNYEPVTFNELLENNRIFKARKSEVNIKSADDREV